MPKGIKDVLGRSTVGRGPEHSIGAVQGKPKAPMPNDSSAPGVTWADASYNRPDRPPKPTSGAPFDLGSKV